MANSCRRRIDDTGMPLTAEFSSPEQESVPEFENQAFERDNIDKNENLSNFCKELEELDDPGPVESVNEKNVEETEGLLINIKATKVYRKVRGTLVKQRGIWFTLIAAFSGSLTGMAIVSLDVSVNANQISFTSFLILLLLSSPIGVYNKSSMRHTWKAYGLLFIRSILGASATCLIYLSYELIPVASAKAIIYCNPVIAGILGWIILNESYSIVEALFALTTLGGVILIAQPPFIFQSNDSSGSDSDLNVVGSILSLLSAFMIAVVWVILRKLSLYGMPFYVNLPIYSIISTIFIGILTTALGQWSLPGCGLDRFALVGMGVLFFILQTLCYLALKTESASVVSIISSSDVMFTFILEFLFYGVVPDFVTAIGAAVIVVSVTGIAVKGFLDDRKRSRSSDGNDNNSETKPCHEDVTTEYDAK